MRKKNSIPVLLFCICVARFAMAQAPPSTLSPAAASPVAAQAGLKALISKHCATCHSGGAQPAVKFGDFLSESVLKKYLDVETAEKSILYRKVESGEMPKIEDGYFLSDEERTSFLQSIRKWVDDKKQAERAVDRGAIERSAMLNKIERVLRSTSKPSDLRFFIVDNTNPLAQTKNSVDPLTKSYGLAKLLNSLSWVPRITNPQLVEGESSLVVISLSSYGWDWYKWNALASVYPYKAQLAGDSTYQRIAAMTRTDVPVLRADWFLFHASRNHLYSFLLSMPETLSELEEKLGINIEKNYSSTDVVRGGFRISGVSSSNRMIERHSTKYGAFWLSYDFSKSTFESNIFNRPFGPVLKSRSQGNLEPFVHAGGEAIFNLPNGLQGYFLANANGKSLLEGPIEIVSDPEEPDRLVRNGVSCMRCHSEGIIRKQDEIANYWRTNKSAEERGPIIQELEAVYNNEKLNAAMDIDRQRFANAMGLLGIPRGIKDPISEVSKGLVRSDKNYFQDHHHFMFPAAFENGFIRDDGVAVKERITSGAYVPGQNVVFFGNENTLFLGEIFKSFQGSTNRKGQAGVPQYQLQLERGGFTNFLVGDLNLAPLAQSFQGISVGETVYVLENKEIIETKILQAYSSPEGRGGAFVYGNSLKDRKLTKAENVYPIRNLWIYKIGEKLELTKKGGAETVQILALKPVSQDYGRPQNSRSCRVEAIISSGLFRTSRTLICLF